MKDNHACIGVDRERGIPCDACREELFWMDYLEQDALAQEREAS